MFASYVSVLLRACAVLRSLYFYITRDEIVAPAPSIANSLGSDTQSEKM